ncbi:MAG: serine/threonine protein kinase [Sandaracinaceae bacterium]|nr:serine/threonine protein kinase [Sandaracinaceae bacterium]
MPRPPRNALPLGSLVDRYVLRSMIGRGGTATVYEAEDRRSGERVAVKVLDPERPDAGRTGEPERHRMLREARLTSALGHPAIVRVLDAGLLEGGRAFLVMERLAGRTLAQRMDECFWLPLDESRDVAAQLLDALEAAHAAGIVHRDVKPTNVFLLEEAPRPRVKLIDFGIGVDLGDPRAA